jgi:cell division transport system permease protein
MRRHTLRYYFSEGVRGIFLHAFSSFAAVGVITACLLIMGSVTLIALNIQELVTELEQSSDISLTVEDHLSDSLARSLGSRISEIDNIMRAEFVSAQQSFEAYAEKLDPILMQGLGPDVFPNRYRIYLVDVMYAEETVSLLRGIRGVAEVEFERELLQTLISIRQVVRLVSAALIAALLVVSLFIMQNTIKLATFERREEIAIMRVVGATKGFIRNPFIVEGFILGSLAGVLAYLAQSFVYSRFSSTLLESIELFAPVAFSELWLPVFAVFVLTGFLVGVFGSVLTIRKYLKA